MNSKINKIGLEALVFISIGNNFDFQVKMCFTKKITPGQERCYRHHFSNFIKIDLESCYRAFLLRINVNEIVLLLLVWHLVSCIDGLGN